MGRRPFRSAEGPGVPGELARWGGSTECSATRATTESPLFNPATKHNQLLPASNHLQELSSQVSEFVENRN